MRTVSIYALRDPRDGEIRYVGQSVSPQTRLSGHVGKASSAPAVRSWLIGLGQQGLKPAVEVLRRETTTTARLAEIDEIELATLAGCQLLNTRHVPALRTLVGGVADPLPRLRVIAAQKSRRRTKAA